MKRYRVTDGGITALLERIDVIPTSLILAQSAEESGWGTSRFVRQGNALFGQWAWGDDEGIVPKGREEGKTHVIKAFGSLMDSVRAYARNINSHPAYQSLRERRAALRADGQMITGWELAETLTKYSERGAEYVDSIHAFDMHSASFPKAANLCDCFLILARDRGQNAPALFEQFRKTGIRPGMFRTGQRVTRNEMNAFIQMRGNVADHRLLDRPDVGNNRTLFKRPCQLRTNAFIGTDRRTNHDQIRIANRLFDIAIGGVGNTKFKHPVTGRLRANRASDFVGKAVALDATCHGRADQAHADKGDCFKQRLGCSVGHFMRSQSL